MNSVRKHSPQFGSDPQWDLECTDELMLRVITPQEGFRPAPPTWHAFQNTPPPKKSGSLPQWDSATFAKAASKYPRTGLHSPPCVAYTRHTKGVAHHSLPSGIGWPP